MLIEDVESGLKSAFAAQTVSPRVLLDRLRLLDESSRKTSQYQDPNYLPFYYHLSKFFAPKSLLNVGLDLGLPLCCFLMGCKSAERVLLFQNAGRGFYSPRIAFSNIKDVKPKGFLLDYHRGSFSDEIMDGKMSIGFDMALITGSFGSDELREILEISWSRLSLDGLLVVERVESDKKVGIMFKDFCKVHNRPHVVIGTRYGTGMTQK